MPDNFYSPAAGPVSVTLTAVTVPHPSREGQWLPGLYWQRDGDFEPGAMVTVTVEALGEAGDGH